MLINILLKLHLPKRFLVAVPEIVNASEVEKTQTTALKVVNANIKNPTFFVPIHAAFE